MMNIPAEHLKQKIGRARVIAGVVLASLVMGAFLYAGLVWWANPTQAQIDIITVPSGQRPASQQPSIQPQSQATPQSMRVQVRGGAHADYDRLVFDWPQNTTVDIQRSGNQFTLTFSRNGEFMFSGVDIRSLARLSALRQDGASQVRLTVTNEAVRAQSKILGNRVVIDLTGGITAQERPVTPSATRTTSQAPQQPEPQPTPKPVQQRQEPAQAATEQQPERPRPTTPRISRDEARSKAERLITQRYGDVLKETAIEKTATITLSSSQPFNMAIFQRHRYLWLVMDEMRASGSGVAPQIDGTLAAQIATPRQVNDASGAATAYIFEIPAGLTPQVRRGDFSWVINLQHGLPTVRNFAITTQLQNGSTHERGSINVALEQFARIYNFRDPLIGDDLWVVPVSQAQSGIVRERRFPELVLLPSNTGVAVQSLAANIEYGISGTNLIIRSPTGISVSGRADDLPSNITERTEDSGRLFDIEAWRSRNSAEYHNNRRALELRIASLKEENRAPDILNLAKLHFANGFAFEALGLLSLAEQLRRELSVNPAFLAVRGAAAAYADKHEEALEDLSHRAVKDQPEAALWRGYALARMGEWAPAYDEFSRTGGLIADYPEPIKSRLAFAMAETSLNMRDLRNGRILMDVIRARDDLNKYETAHLAYLNGIAALQADDQETAEYIFRQVKNGPDRQYRAKSALSLIRLQMDDGRLEGRDAVEALETLRYMWRDGAMEIEVLKDIGLAYFKINNFRQGFDALRYAMNLLPENSHERREINDIIHNQFRSLFIEGGAANMPALEALSTFNQFRFLNPDTSEGDLAIQKLAERLVSIDLLDRAARLLEHQVRSRLSGVEKAMVGARLAAIRLLDRDPSNAIEALTESEISNMPSELQSERNLLKARALSQLNRPAEALSILRGERGEMAMRLQIDIHWRAGQWRQAADSFDPLIRSMIQERGLDVSRMESMPDDLSDLLLNQAVAYILANDIQGVNELNRVYGEPMLQSKNGALFRMLVRSPRPGQLADLQTLQGHVGEVDLFKGFLDAYRDIH